MTTVEAEHGAAPMEKGLKTGALGFVSSVVIGVASTAPGYSLAASLGVVAAAVGLQSPAIMLVAFGVAGLGLFVAVAWLLSRSVLAASPTAEGHAAFASSETATESESESGRDLDLSRPADSSFVPPRPRRRRVQSA